MLKLHEEGGPTIEMAALIIGIQKQPFSTKCLIDEVMQAVQENRE